jgi:hypothetical protein
MYAKLHLQYLGDEHKNMTMAHAFGGAFPVDLLGSA